MKIRAFTILLYTVGLILISYINILAQNKESNIGLKSLKEVLTQLEKDFNVSFNFESSVVKDKYIDFEKYKESPENLEQLLPTLLNSFDLKSERINTGLYVIYQTNNDLNIDSLDDRVAVTGKVTTLNGEPIEGVNIVHKETLFGTSTNQKGEYEIILGKGATMVFSHIGYINKEIPIAAKSKVNVVLEIDTRELEEFVIIGYGSQKRKNITGAISSLSVNSTAAGNQLFSTPDQILQSKLSGVNVTLNSGGPGLSSSVRVRGINSISAGNAPLYIVDGMPIYTQNNSIVREGALNTNVLNTINPIDIESIQVLKDAAAAAIYGSRASKGVIVITTKSGVLNKNRISFNTSFGWQYISKKIALIHPVNYRHVINESRVNAGLSKAFDETENVSSTDWQNEIFQIAPVRRYDISVSKTTEKTHYYASMGYYDQKGIVISSGFKRFNFRVNLAHDISDKIQYGFNLGISRVAIDRIQAGSQGVVGTAVRKSPIFPVYNSSGIYFTADTLQNMENPVALAKEITNQVTNNRVLSKVYGNFNIHKNIMFKTMLGLDFYLTDDYYLVKNNEYTSVGRIKNGTTTQADTENMSWLYENTVDFSKTLSEHDFKILAGFSIQENKFRRIVGRSEGFPIQEIFSINSGTRNEAFGAESIWSMVSYFSRVNYHFRDKLLLAASMRLDGSSKFSSNNRFSTFPSFAIGWRVLNDQSSKTIGVIDELKFRTSWGITGNNDIVDFGASGLSKGGVNYIGQSGVAAVQLQNPDLTWEKTKQLNFGIDVSFNHSKLVINIDLYKKWTNGLLMEVNLPRTSGFAKSIQNLGDMENQGVEMQLRSTNINNEKTAWETTFTISSNRNKITHLPNGETSFGFFGSGSILKEGEPLGSFYGLKIEGVDPETGKYIFLDVDGDQNVSGPTEADRTVIGNSQPKFTGGMENNLRYGQFEVSIFLQFVYGNQLFNGTRYYTEALSGYDNISEGVYDRWKSPGDQASLHQAVWGSGEGNGLVSDRTIEDGSYLRLKSLSIAYHLPNDFLKRIKLKESRIFCMLQNLLTLTRYKGFDPEVNDYENDLQMGFDRSTYPKAKTILLGISIIL